MRHLRLAIPSFVFIATIGTGGASLPAIAAGAPPAAGDVIFNEYAGDNDTNENDFFELLVLGNNVDLRGLRISDNEAGRNGALNNGESVFVLGNDAYLSAVPRGTVIAIWTIATGVTTDTVVNPAARDWKMVLAPGTGVTSGVDRLGGILNAGLSTGGDALYLYLPGPDGGSAGTDNVYLDFISWEEDEATAPAGLADLHLSAAADNAYYSGNTAAGNDQGNQWHRYDGAPNASTTPGEPNPKQDLGSLRTASGKL